MTRDEIIRVAEEAGMPKWLQEDWFANPFDSFALRFAYLIAAAEREECAKLAVEESAEWHICSQSHDTANMIAAAIRARGQG